MALRTALRIRAGSLGRDVGPRFDRGVVAAKAVRVISDLVILFHVLIIFPDHRKRLAVVSGLQMASTAGLDRRGGGILQHVGGESGVPFGS